MHYINSINSFMLLQRWNRDYSILYIEYKMVVIVSYVWAQGINIIYFNDLIKLVGFT